MNKVYGGKIEFNYYKIKDITLDRWYPRAVAKSIDGSIIERWDKAGVKYEEITKNEYDNFHTQIDLH